LNWKGTVLIRGPSLNVGIPIIRIHKNSREDLGMKVKYGNLLLFKEYNK
jgi:hypothetical protein